MTPEIRNLIITLSAMFLLLSGFVWVSEEHTFMSVIVPAFMSLIALMVAIVGPVILCVWYDSRKGI